MNSNPNDAELGPLLRKNYQVSPEKNTAFRAEVWVRIEANRRTPATWSAWLRLNASKLALVAAICATLAGTGGGLLAAAETNRQREQLVQQYLASIDPHQKN